MTVAERSELTRLIGLVEALVAVRNDVMPRDEIEARLHRLEEASTRKEQQLTDITEQLSSQYKVLHGARGLISEVARMRTVIDSTNKWVKLATVAATLLGPALAVGANAIVRSLGI